MANWIVTFQDGTIIKTPYYPNPHMAVGYAKKQHEGQIKTVKYQT